jgi:hypothetical protein
MANSNVPSTRLADAKAQIEMVRLLALTSDLQGSSAAPQSFVVRFRDGDGVRDSIDQVTVAPTTR